MGRISRRKFLSMSCAYAGSITAMSILSACKSAPTPAPTPVVSAATQVPPTPTTPGQITLKGGSAEVWAWKARVTGQVTNLKCTAVEIQGGLKPEAAVIDGSRFSADVSLQEGENQVTAICQPNGSSSAALAYTSRLRDVPFADIQIHIENGQVILDGSGCRSAPQSGSALSKYTWSARETNPAPLVILSPQAYAGKNLSGQQPLSGSELKQVTFQAPQVDGEYYLSLEVSDQAGRSDRSTTYFVIANGQPRLDDWTWQNTAWVENAIVYGVIPRLFGSPGFQSIIGRLDSLQDLGVNALWLAPVNVSPPGDYGYAVVDYFNLNPRYGSKEDFHRLIQEAHQRGIRILMDFVPNHSSLWHPYFQDTVAHGRDSHYWSFYDRDESGMPTNYFDWTNLPNLNYANPEVEQWMIEAFSYWVREFDVDGFRVDAAWGVKERKPDFWPRWRQALKRIKPDLLLLAEASARDDYYFTNGFDAGYDWTDQVGHWAWDLVFSDDKLLIYNLNTALTRNGKGYASDALVFRFINNNDTGGRFITRYGLGMTRAATAMLLTLPGIPCIYTGDEVGAQFTPYGDTQPISWKDPNNLREYHKTLVKLRKETPALHSRKWQVVEVEPHKQVYAYLRFAESADPPILVLLNFLDQSASAEVSLPADSAGFSMSGKLTDLLSGETLTPGSKGNIEIPPFGARILQASK